MEGSKFTKLMIYKHSNDIREAANVTEACIKPPNNGEILVRNYFVGVNAMDMNVMTGRSKLFADKLPFDFGMESLGVIESIGIDIDPKQYPIGQAGLILARRPKTYAQYVYVQPMEFYPIPDVNRHYLGLLDCGLTASIGLDMAGKINSGEVVLITAAAGGTGHIAVQWAKSKGCKVIGLCSTESKCEFLRSIGCDRVINYKVDDLDRILDDEYPDGLDVIWETIGGDTFERLFNHLAIGGRIVIVGAISGYKTVGFPQISIDHLPTKLMGKSASIVGFRFRHYERLFTQYLTELIDLYRNNRLMVRLDTKTINGKDLVGISSIIDAIET